MNVPGWGIGGRTVGKRVTKAQWVETLTWMRRLRLRALAWVVAIALGGVALLSWAAIPVWTVLGVTVAAVAFAVGTIANRLDHPRCWGCGADLKDQASGTHGTACGSCGAVNQRFATDEAPTDDAEAWAEMPAASVEATVVDTGSGEVSPSATDRA